MGAFDAPFFSITPAEASDMDPMQRGLLESTYRAFENGSQFFFTTAGVHSRQVVIIMLTSYVFN